MHRFNRLQRQPLPNHRKAALLRRRFRQVVAEKLPDSTRIITPRRNRTLTGKVLEETNHQHFEVNHRIDAQPPSLALVSIMWKAKSPDLFRESERLQGFVQLLVKT